LELDLIMGRNLILTQIERRPQKTNGRQPQKKMKMEDDLNFFLKNKNDNLKKRNMTSTKMEDNLKKTRKMEDKPKIKLKKWKTTSIKINGRQTNQPKST
jgi:hypothetical protein